MKKLKFKRREKLYLYLELIQKKYLNYQSKLDLSKIFYRIQELYKEEIVYIKDDCSSRIFKTSFGKKNKIKLFSMLTRYINTFNKL